MVRAAAFFGAVARRVGVDIKTANPVGSAARNTRVSSWIPGPAVRDIIPCCNNVTRRSVIQLALWRSPL
jgi:hypothetical protein